MGSVALQHTHRVASFSIGVVIIAAFCAALWAAGDIGITTARGQHGRLLVSWVAPNGPAWDAGVKPGDFLVHRSIANRSATVPLVVQAGGRRIVLGRDATTPTPLDLLYPGLGLCLLALGMHVHARGRDRVAARAFWRMSLCGGVALGVVPAGIHGIAWALILEFAALRLFGPALIDLTAVLPSSNVVSPLRHPWWRLILWGPALILVLFYPLVWWRPALLLPPLTVADDILLACYLIAACLHILIVRRQPFTESERTQIRLLAGGLLGGFLPLVTLTLLPLILVGHALLSAEVSSLAVVVLFLSIGMAIVRTEFLGITALVRRGTLHILVCGALLAGVIAVTWLITLSGARWWDWSPPATAMGVSIAAVFAALIIRPGITRYAEHLLLRDVYDPTDVMLQFSADLARAARHSLGPLIVTRLVTTFDLEFAMLLTARDQYVHAHARSMVPAAALTDISLRARALLTMAAPVQPIADMVASMPVLLLPIGDDSQEERAVLCCGPKRSGNCYTRQDLSLLHALGHQLSGRLHLQAQQDEHGAYFRAFHADTSSNLVVSRNGASTGAPLSRSELRVLRLLARGLSNKAIAEELERDTVTIEKHIRSMRRKLGVWAITDIIGAARRAGMLPPE